MVSGFRHVVNETFGLLGHYAVWQYVIDVSGKIIGCPESSPETSVTVNLDRVTSQKRKVLNKLFIFSMPCAVRIRWLHSCGLWGSQGSVDEDSVLGCSAVSMGGVESPWPWRRRRQILPNAGNNTSHLPTPTSWCGDQDNSRLNLNFIYRNYVCMYENTKYWLSPGRPSQSTSLGYWHG